MNRDNFLIQLSSELSDKALWIYCRFLANDENSTFTMPTAKMREITGLAPATMLKYMNELSLAGLTFLKRGVDGSRWYISDTINNEWKKEASYRISKHKK